MHVGGAAPDRQTALDSAHRFLARMSDGAKRRIAIEHDDRVWTAREVYPFAREHGLPFLADNLHNAVLPSTPALSTAELLTLASESWRVLGLRPKHHLASQSRERRRGAHADYIDPLDWNRQPTSQG